MKKLIEKYLHRLKSNWRRDLGFNCVEYLTRASLILKSESHSICDPHIFSLLGLTWKKTKLGGIYLGFIPACLLGSDSLLETLQHTATADEARVSSNCLPSGRCGVRVLSAVRVNAID